MRIFPILSLLLASQLLVGCEMLQRLTPGRQAPAAEPATGEAAADIPEAQCPPPVELACAEPEVKVVERIIERTRERLVEVPVARDKLVLGSVETVAIEPGGLRLRSLVDTSAPTSSLSAQKLTPFERDGKDWIRFELTDPDEKKAEPVTIELPVKRFVRVTRPGFDSQRRPVVEMSLTVGEVTHMVEVNLTDRGASDYPLLVGRNFLKDAAVVDVSRQHVQGRPREGSYK
ncbi:ATP-dependent zinc protease family protein [Microbulbifer sp.]|uniref:ATP-dependent zinc protease family protein n=1 Tax=Microbulbifer sp. TaxID=1908541 RepID=UPI003F303B99